MKNRIKDLVLVILIVIILVGVFILCKLAIQKIGDCAVNETVEAENTENEIFDTSIMDTTYVDYNVYEFKDGSWFICSDTENMYVFQPVELGDWDYEVRNKDELCRIIACYFMNKYGTDENIALQKICDIINEVAENGI